FPAARMRPRSSGKVPNDTTEPATRTAEEPTMRYRYTEAERAAFDIVRAIRVGDADADMAEALGADRLAARAPSDEVVRRLYDRAADHGHEGLVMLTSALGRLALAGLTALAHAQQRSVDDLLADYEAHLTTDRTFDDEP